MPARRPDPIPYPNPPPPPPAPKIDQRMLETVVADLLDAGTSPKEFKDAVRRSMPTVSDNDIDAAARTVLAGRQFTADGRPRRQTVSLERWVRRQLLHDIYHPGPASRMPTVPICGRRPDPD
jgi:hypothetical protein